MGYNKDTKAPMPGEAIRLKDIRIAKVLQEDIRTLPNIRAPTTIRVPT